MGLVREFIARTLVVLALAAGAAALGLWWGSLLTIKTAGTLKGANLSAATHQVSAELDRLAPGTSSLPGVEADIQAALKDPAVTQALAASTPSGSSLLTSQLSQVDPELAGVLSGQGLLVSSGRHDLASLAVKLRRAAELAALSAALSAAMALALAPMRRTVLRHLAFGAALVGGAATVFTWALPALVGHLTRGGVNHFATDVLSGGAPVRSVLLACLIAGAAVFAATHLFELLYTGKRVRYDPAAGPLARGRSV